MAQSVNLSVSGLYTSLNDYQGLPPGAFDVADNVESRYKNVMEPRRGFEGLPNSSMDPAHFIRLTNFLVSGVEREIGLTSDRDLRYYTGANPWPLLPGSLSQNIQAPDAINAKCRFITAGQNLYLTAQDGVRSLASGSTSQLLRAGVPKGLNLDAVTNGDTSGFFNNNIVVNTTADLTSGSAILANLGTYTGIVVGQYISGAPNQASLIVQDLTYTAIPFAAAGNAITIAYTTGGTAGAEVVTVVGNAISVKIQTTVSTANQIRTAVNASSAAIALVSVAVSGTGTNTQTAPTGPTHLAGGLDSITPGTKVARIDPAIDLVIQTGTIAVASTSITNVASITGVVAGVLVTGDGIPDGATVVSTSGGGPYTVVISSPAIKAASGVTLTFVKPEIITLDQNVNESATSVPIHFYTGSQVGYRMLFGRVESDVSSGSTTRLGAPSAIALASNTTGYDTNVTVTGTLPKNSDNEITFVQLYRSAQTSSVDITPLDQYNLVYERALVAGDFSARVITITDDVPDSLKGIALYSGSDQEGSLQQNNPPPMAWDMCKFRDFTLFGNITQPTTTKFTITGVGSPSGLQSGDTITISGSFLGVAFSEAYTGAGSENQASRQFKVSTSGSPSQNITDTAASLIRVINYDNAVPVHAILLSTSTDLPGQISLEADNPSYDTFTVTASAHATAYDPTLTNLVSDVNTVVNAVMVSKSGELEAVPATNQFFAGDSSSPVLRLIPLRDYVIVLKSDGIYKVLGTTPNSLIINPFDLTTKIIGADTAVSLNSGVWMFSNQGVVSISDGGVNAKSIPIDDQLNAITGTFLDNVVDNAFAIGYESDRKYILCIPKSANTFAEVEYNYNYVTNCWTTWSRSLYFGYIHSIEDKMYVARADAEDLGVSKERKSLSYKDFADEALDVTITAVSDTSVTLTDAGSVSAGDVLFQDATHFSPILSVDLATNTIVVQFAVGFIAGAATVLKAYLCEMTWKQVFGDNPAFVRQFSEGLFLFKNTRFNNAVGRFSTDFSQNGEDVDLTSTSSGLWGLFPWGDVPWGGTSLPSKIRFYLPQDKQLGSYLIPSLRIKQGYSDFRCQGMSITHFPVSMEVGK